jgi:hypothetical protein
MSTKDGAIQFWNVYKLNQIYMDQPVRNVKSTDMDNRPTPHVINA